MSDHEIKELKKLIYQLFQEESKIKKTLGHHSKEYKIVRSKIKILNDKIEDSEIDLKLKELKIKYVLHLNEHTDQAAWKVKMFIDYFLDKNDMVPKSKRYILSEPFCYIIEFRTNKQCTQFKSRIKTLETLYNFARIRNKNVLTIYIDPEHISKVDIDIKSEFESYNSSTESIKKFKL
jgi:hypothetical protein